LNFLAGLPGPLFCSSFADPSIHRSIDPSLRRSVPHQKENAGFRFASFWHQKPMHPDQHHSEYQLRIPSEPEPFPIKEPPDPPENPDMPVREPDPEEPGQI
jgi:hypothetical protein